MKGGFLGVDLFFVLSGYLITSLLLIEWEHSQRIVLLRFWARRARRLFPALVVIVFSALLLSAIFSRINLGPTRRDTLSSLFYFNNWHQIVANESYFNRMGAASLLQHIWSLSVEEQFYLVWPLVLVPGLIFLGRKRLPYAVIAGIAGSAALMWLVYKPFPADPSRVYYGTDTRAFLLLMGILLALVWPHIERIRGVGLQLLQLLGVAALATTIYLFFTMPDPSFNATYFHGGDLAASFCFAVLIASVAHPESLLNHALGIAPLRWIGERSYGIYLWHWPILVLTKPEVSLSWSGAGAILGQAVIIVTAAALSYHFIEQPIRSGRAQKRLASYGVRRRRELVLGGAVAIVAAFALLSVAPGATNAEGSNGPPPNDHHHHHHPHHHPGGGKHPGHHKRNKNALPKGHILALGDSVMDGCGWALKSDFGYRIHVDAVVGRQVRDTIRSIHQYRVQKRLPKIVIIQVGNNGPLYYQDMKLLRHALRGVTDIVVVNVRNATSWETESNTAITQWISGWHIVHLADWYHHSQPSWLSDGTHPWPKYCPVYARVIKNALRGTHT
jgi:peptidoglycan/LPS O-acetylase OafA/YrhL